MNSLPGATKFSFSIITPEQRLMVESFHVLQYHIYTLALRQYLKNRLPGYDYDKHFGGVFYIFLRGPGKDSPNAGLFWIWQGRCCRLSPVRSSAVRRLDF